MFSTQAFVCERRPGSQRKGTKFISKLSLLLSAATSWQIGEMDSATVGNRKLLKPSRFSLPCVGW